MHLVTQLRLLIAVQIFGLLILVTLIILGLANSAGVKRDRQLTAHTETVLSKSQNECSQIYTSADFGGRLAMVGLTNGASKEDYREQFRKCVTELKKLVGDNQAQAANVDAILEVAENRFKLQDEMLDLTRRSQNGEALVTPVSKNIESIESAHTVEVAFNNFAEQEHKLLRARNANLQYSQERMNALFVVLSILALVFSASFGWLAFKAIKGKQRIAARMENQIHRTEGSSREVIKEADLLQLVNLIKQGEI